MAEGIASSVSTLRPPPDWPKIVTVFGSPPNCGDVRAHPFQRLNDIQHAGIAGGREVLAELAQVRKPENVEAMIDGHDDHVAAAREIRSVVIGRRS